MNKAVGRRVRSGRKQLALLQTELGSRVGVTFQQIQKSENGMNRLTAGKLTLIAEALQLTARPSVFGQVQSRCVACSHAGSMRMRENQEALVAYLPSDGSVCRLQGVRRQEGWDMGGALLSGCCGVADFAALRAASVAGDRAVIPNCPYCKSEAQLVTGAVVWRHRQDLAGKKVWACANYPACDVYVGCNRGTENPLGRLSNRELRALKARVHVLFDPLWQKKMKRDKVKKSVARELGYRWLAEQMDINFHSCQMQLATSMRSGAGRRSKRWKIFIGGIMSKSELSPVALPFSRECMHGKAPEYSTIAVTSSLRNRSERTGNVVHCPLAALLSLLAGR